MRTYIVTVIAMLLAVPGPALAGHTTFNALATPPVDWLYPEVDVDEVGFRGLIPVILLDMENVAEAPVANQDGTLGTNQAN